MVTRAKTILGLKGGGRAMINVRWLSVALALPAAPAFAEAPPRALFLFAIGLAKFDAKVRQWRTLGPEAGSNSGRRKNRSEHNSVESFLGLTNGGFSPFRSNGAFCVSQKSQW